MFNYNVLIYGSKTTQRVCHLPELCRLSHKNDRLRKWSTNWSNRRKPKHIHHPSVTPPPTAHWSSTLCRPITVYLITIEQTQWLRNSLQCTISSWVHLSASVSCRYRNLHCWMSSDILSHCWCSRKNCYRQSRISCTCSRTCSKSGCIISSVLAISHRMTRDLNYHAWSKNRFQCRMLTWGKFTRSSNNGSQWVIIMVHGHIAV